MVLLNPSSQHVEIASSVQRHDIPRHGVNQLATVLAQHAVVAKISTSAHAQKRLVHISALEDDSFGKTRVLGHHYTSLFAYVRNTLAIGYLVLQTCLRQLILQQRNVRDH